MNVDYPVRLLADPSGGFTVTFPDVPGAITEGEDRAEALRHAADALETVLGAHMRDGKDIPAPSGRGRVRVRPSAMGIIKLAIYQAMREQRVTKTDLGRRLKWHLPQVDRVLDLRHASQMSQLEAALQALGLSLKVDVEKAA